MMKSKADAYTHLWVKDIAENDVIRDFYLVREKRGGTTRRGEAFLSLILADKTGELEAKIWDRAQELSPLFQEGHVIEVEGRANSYRGQIQLTISDLRVKNKEEIDQGIFLESAPEEPLKMFQSLSEILRQIKNKNLKRLVEKFLNDRDFVSHLKKSPAAKNFHHAYLGGLLEHTLSVCQLATLVANHYPELDRDLLLTAAFLHDIGKIRELRYESHIDYTDEGRLLGHVVMGAAMLDEKLDDIKAFPEDLALRLKHLILSHHGQYDFGSPKRPKFLEAFALNLIDDLDAKIKGLGRFMEKDRQEGAWTEYNRLFERFFLKGELFPVSKEFKKISEEDDRQGTLFSSSR